MLKRLSVPVIALLALSQIAVAQYSMTLENDALVPGNMAYEFDVVIASTSGTIALTSYQLFFTYNTAIAGSGTLSFSYVGGSSALTNPPTNFAGILTDGAVSNLGAASNPGTDNITGTPVKVGRFRISNTVAFQAQPSNVAWDFGGSLFTVVNLSNANATNPSNHSSTLNDPPLPIQLTSFSAAAVSANEVRITWSTQSETNNYGFEVQKAATNSNAAYAVIPNSFVAGQGTTTETHSYSFTDVTATQGTWYYRLKQIDLDGTVYFSDGVQSNGVTSVGVRPLPTSYALDQNYPNPFNPSTMIEFALPKESRVMLAVYNVIGQQVATLVEETRPAGYYAVQFNGAHLASGLYFYKLTAEQASFVRKMMIVK